MVFNCLRGERRSSGEGLISALQPRIVGLHEPHPQGPFPRRFIIGTGKLIITSDSMSERVVICGTDSDVDPTWERLAVWEDGEWVEGDPIIEEPLLGDELTTDEIFQRIDGPGIYAFEPEDAPA